MSTSTPQQSQTLTVYHPIAIAASSIEELAVESQQLARRLSRDSNTSVSEHVARRLREQPGANVRRVLFARDRAEALRALSEPAGPTSVTGEVVSREARIGFLFSGPSKEQSLREIYEREAAFRGAFDECVALSGTALLSHLDTPPDIESPEGLRLLFALEYALFRQWQAWGIRPAAVMGYSFGELIAATASGVFDLRDGFALCSARAELLSTIEPGAMVSVGMSIEQIQPLLEGGMQIAIHRSPRSSVVSGSPGEISALEDTLKRADLAYQRLDLRLAGHSRQAAKVAEAFCERVAAVTRRAPEVPLISNVDGARASAEAITDPRHWGRQLAQTVQFATGLQTLVECGCRILLEIGPGHNLTALSSQQLQGLEVDAIASLRTVVKTPSVHLALLRGLARLWTLGVEVDWGRVRPREI